MGELGLSRGVSSWCRSFAHVLVGLAFFGSLCGITGCSTLGHRPHAGQQTAAQTRRVPLSHAVRDAFLDVQTWLPAAAAVVFAAADLDEPVSDWATEQTPLFSSRDAARNASDYLNWALQAETLATVLARPTGEVDKPWWQAKAKPLGVELLAAGVPSGITQGLKPLANRRRPDGSDNRSFPSGHATSAFSMAALSNRNLDAINPSPGIKYPLQIGNILMASGVAWARIEGAQHFPSDVLAGTAIGHFFSAVIHDVFLGISPSRRVQLIVEPSKEETMVYIVFPF
jgi:membrane-associated phospholipid phosphatase